MGQETKTTKKHKRQQNSFDSCLKWATVGQGNAGNGQEKRVWPYFKQKAQGEVSEAVTAGLTARLGAIDFCVCSLLIHQLCTGTIFLPTENSNPFKTAAASKLHNPPDH